MLKHPHRFAKNWSVITGAGIPVLASGGVQNFTITIPAGATSATVTINSVGSLAAIFDGDWLSSVSTAQGRLCATRLELTNSTTITAYRNTLDASRTVMVSGCIIDWNSTAVESVQSGIINVALASTNTAAISSVDTSRSVVIPLGYTTNSTSLNPAIMNHMIDLTNSTTVTATRGSISDSITVGFMVVQFKAAVIQSIQNVLISDSSANTSYNAALPLSVNPNNCMTIYRGSYGAGTTWANEQHNVKLADASTVTATRTGTGATARNVGATIIEFKPGVIRSRVANVQTFATTTSQYALGATEVPAKTACYSCGANTTGTTIAQMFSSAKLTTVADESSSNDFIEYSKSAALQTNSMNAEVIKFY